MNNDVDHHQTQQKSHAIGTIIDLTAVLIEERIIKQEERNRQKTVFCDVQIKMQIYAQCF